MCESVPGWRRRMLAGGRDYAEVTGPPPEGFVRLGPAERRVSTLQGRDPRPGAGLIFSLLIAVGAGLEVVQALVSSSTWRVVTQAAGVVVLFGGVGIWDVLTRSWLAARHTCSCARPPMWIRVIPSVHRDTYTPGRSIASSGAELEREEIFVGARRGSAREQRGVIHG